MSNELRVTCATKVNFDNQPQVWKSEGAASGENSINHFAGDAGQADVEALDFQAESRVLDAEQLEHRGVEIR